MDSETWYGLSALFLTRHSVRKFSILNVEAISLVVGSDIESYAMKFRG